MFSKLPYFYMFMLIMGLGTLLSVSSIHWLGIWAGLEINLIGFLPLLVYSKTTMESESGVKYFVAQAMGSALLLMGSLLMFSMTYTWEICSQNFFDMTENLNLNSISIIMIMSGLLLKLGMFPFHYWLPSVMGGLSWFSCLLLATWQKLAPLFLMISLFEQNTYYWVLLIMCLMSASSSILGGIGGFNQTQIRALLAYSSIGHLGWIVFSCLHSEWVMKTYLLIYVAISIILFLSLLHSNSTMMKNISDLKNWSSARSVMMVMLLSLGGLPPLLGFVSKWLVMFYSISGPYKVFIMFFIIGSLLSLFYYLNLFFSMYLSELKKYNLKAQMNTLFFYDSSGLIFFNLVSVILILQYSFFTSL